MLNKLGIKIENISFHIGSIYGFGGQTQKKIIQMGLNLDLDNIQEKERFLCTHFNTKDYNSFLGNSLDYLKRVIEIAEENQIKILVKNLSFKYKNIHGELSSYRKRYN